MQTQNPSLDHALMSFRNMIKKENHFNHYGRCVVLLEKYEEQAL